MTRRITDNQNELNLGWQFFHWHRHGILHTFSFYFADQGASSWLYDAINKSCMDWISYLIDGEYMEDEKPRILEISQILNGTINLSEDECIDCLVDDFSDYEK